MIGPVLTAVALLLIAGAVHVASILMLPWFAPDDGFHRLNAHAQDNRLTLVGAADLRVSMPNSDPNVAIAVCRYVLDKGPVRVRLAPGQTPTAIVVLRRGAGVFHSVSDRAASQGILDVVIATAEQMEDITDQDSDDDPVQEIRITSPDETGLVLIRALVPLPSQRADIEAGLRTATCDAEVIEQ